MTWFMDVSTGWGGWPRKGCHPGNRMVSTEASGEAEGGQQGWVLGLGADRESQRKRIQDLPDVGKGA